MKTTFESKDTERYFFKVARELGIMHVSWKEDHTITKADVDALVNSAKGVSDATIKSEPFFDAP